EDALELAGRGAAGLGERAGHRLLEGLGRLARLGVEPGADAVGVGLPLGEELVGMAEEAPEVIGEPRERIAALGLGLRVRPRDAARALFAHLCTARSLRLGAPARSAAPRSRVASSRVSARSLMSSPPSSAAASARRPEAARSRRREGAP